MSAIPKHKMTMEEYIEFDKNSEGRWEYFDGEVIDMAGGSVSPNRMSYDHGSKFTAYQSIESFREYLLIAQDRPHITQYARQPDGQWLRKDIEGMESMMKMICLECELTFEEIYRQVNFSPSEAVLRPV